MASATTTPRWKAGSRPSNSLELGEKFESYAEVKEKSFEYIEVFYNQRRLHSSIGYLSPAEFERRHRERLALPEAA